MAETRYEFTEISKFPQMSSLKSKTGTLILFIHTHTYKYIFKRTVAEWSWYFPLTNEIEISVAAPWFSLLSRTQGILSVA